MLCATGSGSSYCTLFTEKMIYLFSMYSLSDLGVSSNLIGSLSRSNWALFTPYGVNNAA